MMNIGAAAAIGCVGFMSLGVAGIMLQVARKVGQRYISINSSWREDPRLTIPLIILVALGLALIGASCLMIAKAVILKTALPNAQLMLYSIGGGFLLALSAFGGLRALKIWVEKNRPL